MDANIIDVFLAYGGGDDRGVGQTVIGAAFTETDAKVIAHKQGFFGGDGSVYKGKALLLPDNRIVLLHKDIPYPFDVNVNLEKRKKEVAEAAKRKLLQTMTPEELNALNIRL